MKSAFLQPEPPGKLALLGGIVLLLLTSLFCLVAMYGGATLAAHAFTGPTATISRDIASVNAEYSKSMRRSRPNGVLVRLKSDADTYFVEPLLLTTPFSATWENARHAELVYERAKTMYKEKPVQRVVGITLDKRFYLNPGIYTLERLFQALLLFAIGGIGLAAIGYLLYQHLRIKS